MSLTISQPVIVSPANATSAPPGTKIVFRIMVTNTTGMMIPQQTLATVLSPGLVFISTEQISGPLSVVGLNNGFDLQVVRESTTSFGIFFPTGFDAGASATFLVTVQIMQPAIIGSTVSITVFIVPVNEEPIIPFVASLTVAAPVADVTVAVFERGGSSAYVGNIINFETILTNRGPSNAVNVILVQQVNSNRLKWVQISGPTATTPIPMSLSTSSSSSSSSSAFGAIDSCLPASSVTIPVLGPGEAAHFVLSVISEKCGQLNVVARATSTITADPNLENNIGFAQVRVLKTKSSSSSKKKPEEESKR